MWKTVKKTNQQSTVGFRTQMFTYFLRVKKGIIHPIESKALWYLLLLLAKMLIRLCVHKYENPNYFHKDAHTKIQLHN